MKIAELIKSYIKRTNESTEHFLRRVGICRMTYIKLCTGKKIGLNSLTKLLNTCGYRLVAIPVKSISTQETNIEEIELFKELPSVINFYNKVTLFEKDQCDKGELITALEASIQDLRQNLAEAFKKKYERTGQSLKSNDTSVRLIPE